MNNIKTSLDPVTESDDQAISLPIFKAKLLQRIVSSYCIQHLSSQSLLSSPPSGTTIQATCGHLRHSFANSDGQFMIISSSFFIYCSTDTIGLSLSYL